jgi:DNA-binding response OmpR family regulator
MFVITAGREFHPALKVHYSTIASIPRIRIKFIGIQVFRVITKKIQSFSARMMTNHGMIEVTEKIFLGELSLKEHVFIVDDNQEIIELLQDILESEGFQVSSAESGEKALAMLKQGHAPNIILLDIMMPNMSGYELCSQIRREWDLPILFLSAKGKPVDKVVGLEIGADDYITKPFDTEELLARIRAHLRRYERIRKQSQEERANRETSSSPITVLRFKGLEIHKETYSVFVNGQKIELSTKEFQLLSFLAENAGIVFTREQIYDRVWGYGYGSLNTVTVHIKNLREKLEQERTFIKTQWGTGYVFIGEKI